MMKFMTSGVLTLALGLSTVASAHNHAQDKNQDDMTETLTAPDISSEMIAENFYILKGPGGNVGVSVGEDGVYIIDDKFSRFADQILTNQRRVRRGPETTRISLVGPTHCARLTHR